MAHELSRQQTWIKEVDGESFLIATLNSHLDRDFVNKAFASDDFYWAKELSSEHLETLIAHSINLGVYKILPAKSEPKSDEKFGLRAVSPSRGSPYTQENLEQIGYARISTDFVTTAYLTDVYVVEAYRGKGFAKWLLECCDESLKTIPALRNVLLIAGKNVVQFYKDNLNMRDVQDEKDFTIMHRATWSIKGH